jgi:hypothetical protein
MATRKNSHGHPVTRRQSALGRLHTAMSQSKEEGARARLSKAVDNTIANIKTLEAGSPLHTMRKERNRGEKKAAA